YIKGRVDFLQPIEHFLQPLFALLFADKISRRRFVARLGLNNGARQLYELIAGLFRHVECKAFAQERPNEHDEKKRDSGLRGNTPFLPKLAERLALFRELAL